MKKTEQLSRIDIENLLMPEIIKSLQRLGGMATKSELYEDLKENATTISEDYIQLEKYLVKLTIVINHLTMTLISQQNIYYLLDYLKNLHVRPIN